MALGVPSPFPLFSGIRIFPEETGFPARRDVFCFSPGKTEPNRRRVPKGCFSRGTLPIAILSGDPNLSRNPPESQGKMLVLEKNYG